MFIRNGCSDAHVRNSSEYFCFTLLSKFTFTLSVFQKRVSTLKKLNEPYHNECNTCSHAASEIMVGYRPSKLRSTQTAFRLSFFSSVKNDLSFEFNFRDGLLASGLDKTGDVLGSEYLSQLEQLKKPKFNRG